jgi:hypothetical protein
MKIFPLTIYVLLKPFIQILPSDSKKSLWDSRTTATLVVSGFFCFASRLASGEDLKTLIISTTFNQKVLQIKSSQNLPRMPIAIRGAKQKKHQK